MGTFAVLVVLIVTVGLVVRKIYKDKKSGISLQCGVKCDRCCAGCASCGESGSALPDSKK